jgi:hypothetical protein
MRENDAAMNSQAQTGGPVMLTRRTDMDGRRSQPQ